MASEVKFDLRFETSDFETPHDPSFKSYAYCYFYGLRGHYSLHMASEVKFDLGFETSDLETQHDQSFKSHMLVSLGTCKRT